MLDLILSGATVVDGTGRPAYRADMAIQDGLIAAIGNLSRAEAHERLDLKGEVVAPGFIDVHSHSDLMLLVDPRGLSKIHQGVTTEVVGNCGYSPAPLTDQTAADIQKLHEFFGSSVHDLGWEWRSMADFLSRYSVKGLGVNVVPLVGNVPLRVAAMGFDHRPASTDELSTMRSLLRESLEEGAFGLSTGLIYPPSAFADTDELAELCSQLRPIGGLYFTHIRGEAHSLMRAVAEALEIGERSGAPVHIAHHKAMLKPNWGRIRQAIQLCEWACERGQDVTFDVYPYTAGNSTLTMVLPDWVHAGGLPRLLARLEDPTTRSAIRGELLASAWEWDQIYIAWAASEANKGIEGKSVAEIASERGMDAVDTYLSLVVEERARAQVILFVTDESDLRYVIGHHLSMIGSDGSALAPEGPLSEGLPHPRNYGTFPRVLGHYVRDIGLISLEEAIRKMTFAPAYKLGLRKKGRLAPGMDADLVVFDPSTIRDLATYANPHQFPEGISHVLVNGEFAVKDGVHTGVLNGRVLRRKVD